MQKRQNEIDGHREMRSLLNTCADLVAGPVLSKCGKVAGVKYALEGACWHQPEFAGQHAHALQQLTSSAASISTNYPLKPSLQLLRTLKLLL